ncbi:MAG: aminopeptidase [Longimicrobiales bacterium]
MRSSDPAGSEAPGVGTVGTRRIAGRIVLGVAAALAVVGAWACSPIYVIKAGIAEARILAARRPIPEVLGDSATPADVRAKLTFVMEARRFARDELGIDVGDSYTMYTRLDRDTLALVVSAAHKDRLVPKTWWFPIVGHVPYKGYFDLDDALNAQADLEREGMDTYLRPTAAFSTLGWFNDPILSTVLRSDDVEVVETVLHELSHQYLFVPGRVGFNESFATFVGRAGAARFFCTRDGGGPDTVKCLRAQARWRDYQRFGVFVDGLVEELQGLYARTDLTRDEILSRREAVFTAALERFDAEVGPTFENVTFGGFRTTPLNNATLLARMRYYHRLPDFQALLEREGDLPSTLRWLRDRVDDVDDPFSLLPPSNPTL